MNPKTKTVVRIGGQEYKLAGNVSEEYMHAVAIYVDHKMAEIKSAYTDLNTTMIAVLTALNIADELIRERGGEQAPGIAPAREEPLQQSFVFKRDAPVARGRK